MTEQEKREKVIKWLEHCVTTDIIDSCVKAHCPYLGGSTKGNCITNLMRDALALLKAQKPRLVTCEEWDKWRHIKDGERDPLFLQLDHTGGVWILKPDAWHEVAFLTGEIKVWDKKPSVEEMVVKWNDKT